MNMASLKTYDIKILVLGMILGGLAGFIGMVASTTLIHTKHQHEQIQVLKSQLEQSQTINHSLQQQNELLSEEAMLLRLHLKQSCNEAMEIEPSFPTALNAQKAIHQL